MSCNHRSCIDPCSESGELVPVLSPGPIAESLEIKETAASGILNKSAKKATQAPAGSKMSVTSTFAKRGSKIESKAHHVKFANTFDSLAGTDHALPDAMHCLIWSQRPSNL